MSQIKTIHPWLNRLLGISLAIAAFMVSPASAEPTFTLRGTITDLAAAPVASAEVYLYRTANTRRPADFISAKTTADGVYRLAVPAASYWGVARIKQGERFGPMQLGQRHSGDPVQIVVGDEPVTTVDFTVADLKEMAQKRQKVNSDVTAASGTIVGSDGKPAANACAYARITRLQETLPEYVSAWTGTDGRFILFLPPGTYFWGASREFPPPALPNLVSAPAAEGRTDLKLILQE